MNSSEPQLLSKALAELIALRGFARARSANDLQDAWQKVAGDAWAAATKAIKVTRGVLYVDVRSSALLGELAAFHGPDLTTRMQQQSPQLRVKSIKFRLSGM